jgi:multimeric flavodoxin WrbA
MNSENECLRVVGTGGTLREGSTSLGALRRALSAADEAGAEVELLDLRQLR